MEQAEGEEQKVTDEETIRLKRVFRRYLHRAQKRKKELMDGSVVIPSVRPKRRYEKSLRNDRCAAFVAIRGEMVRKFLELVRMEYNLTDGAFRYMNLYS